MLDVVAEGGEEEGEALLGAEAVEEAAELGQAEDRLLGGGGVIISDFCMKMVSGFTQLR